MTTSGMVDTTAGEQPARARETTMRQLRFLLQSRAGEDHEPDRDTLNALVMEAIEDLFDAAIAHEWGDVGAVDIESTEGPWRVAIRLTRDASLREYACARGRARGWR